jgi:hypothetical protein
LFLFFFFWLVFNSNIPLRSCPWSWSPIPLFFVLFLFVVSHFFSPILSWTFPPHYTVVTAIIKVPPIFTLINSTANSQFFFFSRELLALTTEMLSSLASRLPHSPGFPPPGWRLLVFLARSEPLKPQSSDFSVPTLSPL